MVRSSIFAKHDNNDEYGLLDTKPRPVLVNHSKLCITHNCIKEIFEGEKQEYSLRQLNVDQDDKSVKSAWVMPFVTKSKVPFAECVTYSCC